MIRGDGRLFIVAADHPARGALAVGKNATAMANRYDLLERMAIALSRPGVDGVLGTPDIIDDLAALGLLDDKIIVGSMNRGGLREHPSRWMTATQAMTSMRWSTRESTSRRRLSA